MDISGGNIRSAETETRSSRPPIRKKKMKLLPALLCAGLSYGTFCEKSSRIGIQVTAAAAAEAFDGSRATAAAASVKGRHHNLNSNNDDDDDDDNDNDLLILDDLDAYDFDEPNDRSFGSEIDDNDDTNNNDNIQSDTGPMPPDIIVVAAVDGTLAGISKKTGRVLWKQSEDVSAFSTSHTSSLMVSTTNPAMKRNKKFRGDASQILKPLVSTTTTTKSASDATYKAVPSVDGTIYTTTNEISMTTSVKDLVAKSPFLDPQGKFYVGSRYASAAALDGDTGLILRVVSSSTPTNQDGDDDDASSLPTLEGRNVIWVGRVDHEITVQDAKTGMIDAQFSVAEIMSVADMRGIMGTDARKPEQALPQYDGSSLSSSSSNSNPNAVTTASNGDIKLPSTLVATPNGNVALWNFEDDKFSWVAIKAFDSPIAYAMDVTTGLTMGVDIIPDVTDPSANIDDLTREMERQSEMASLTDTPVVGAMPNGQLYALPLRRKRSSAMGKATNGATAIVSMPSVAAVASSGSDTKPKTRTVSQLPGRPNANFHQNDHNSNQQYNPAAKTGTLVAKKPCVSTSPTYPSCLMESINDRRIVPETAPAIGDGKHQLPDGSLAVTTSNLDKEDGGFIHAKYGFVSREELGGFYHPEYGYVSPRDLYTNKKSDQKIFRRVLGSWLPPTIALLFVVSFELGRRKRSKDEKKDFFLTPEQMGKINGTVPGDDKYNDEQRDFDKMKRNEVISVSEDVLGYGGHGTVVYKGVLDGRNVAVKRMLKAYHASADREISLLIESDGDPNVVRYFLKEVRGDFVYLALELCDLSIHELIGVLREKQQENGLSILSDVNESACVISSESMNATLRILFQIASGVKHLHSLRIVHRDLKPANILLAISKGGKKKVKEDGPIFTTFVQNYYDAKISDMGLGKQLIGQSSIGASFIGESSFRGNKSGANSIGVGPGTVGWQAPEVMAMRSTTDSSVARSIDSTNPNGESREFATNDPPAGIRTSRSVDIFSLGCIFYSLLIPGFHPFGEWFEREANIMHNRPNLSPLKKISSEAYHLISSMLQRNPKLRPTAKEVCKHPFFWKSQKKLTFLCDFSDRLETDLITQASSNVFNSLAIERGAAEVVGTSWEAKLHSALIDNVQKFRTYDYSCVRDLLRLIRNKHHHFEELPEAFRLSTVPNQDALYEYFSSKFPALIIHCYSFCGQNLTEDDQMVSKFDISLAKYDIKEVSTAPTSVTLKKKQVTSDKEINSIDLTTSDVSPEEPKHDVVNGVCQVVTDESDIEELDDDIIVWEGSIAAKTFNCRGWHRSQDEWSRHIEPFYKKRDPAAKRCMEDPKFRTRLCNHWDTNLGTFCPMRKKNKCVFAHGPAELRVKEGKKNRWGKLVDKNGNNSNPMHSGGEDTYGAAKSIEKVRKEEGKWNSSKDRKKNQGPVSARKKKPGTNPNPSKQKTGPKPPG